IEENLDDALAKVAALTAKGEPASIGLVGNCADVFQAIADKGIVPDIVTDQTSAHDPLNGYIPSGMTYEAALQLRADDPATYEKRSLKTIAKHVRAMLDLQAKGAETFDYGNNIRHFAKEQGVENAFDFP